MRKLVAVAAVASLAACGSNPVRSMSAPAPATALDCSLRMMSGLGYTPVRGGVSDGYIVFDRTYTQGMLGQDRTRAVITVTQAGDQLRVTAVGHDEKDRQIRVNQETMGHAEAMMSSCTNVQTGA